MIPVPGSCGGVFGGLSVSVPAELTGSHTLMCAVHLPRPWPSGAPVSGPCCTATFFAGPLILALAESIKLLKIRCDESVRDQCILHIFRPEPLAECLSHYFTSVISISTLSG